MRCAHRRSPLAKPVYLAYVCAMTTQAIKLDLSKRPAEPELIGLAGLTRAELRQALIDHAGVDEKKAKMRADQLWRWIYNFGATSFDQMTNVSLDLRAVLQRKFTLARAEIVERLVSVDEVVED